LASRLQDAEATKLDWKEIAEEQRLITGLLRGNVPGNRAEDRLDHIKAKLKSRSLNYGVVVLKKPMGGENWGYVCNPITLQEQKFYNHDWVGNFCHVIFAVPDIPRGLIKTDGFQEKADHYASDSVRRITGRGEHNGCIKAAERIWDNLVNDGYQPKLVLVKKEPGGFDNFAYSVPCIDNYHKWHTGSYRFGPFRRGKRKYCVGIRI